MNEKNSPKDKITLHKSVIEQHLKTNFIEKKTNNEQNSPNERSNSSPLVKLQTFLTNSKDNKIKKDLQFFTFEEKEVKNLLQSEPQKNCFLPKNITTACDKSFSCSNS